MSPSSRCNRTCLKTLAYRMTWLTYVCLHMKTIRHHGTYYREEQTVRVQNRLFIDSVQRATSGFKIFQIAIAIQKETNDEEFMDKDIL